MQTNLHKRRFILNSMGAIICASSLGLKQAKAVELKDALSPRAVGDPAAPLRIIEYFSLSCSHCADFHRDTYPSLKREWIDKGKAHFEYRDFPLQGPAIYAHALARIVPQEAYEDMLTTLFERRQDWAGAQNPVAELSRIARTAGIGQNTFIKEVVQNRPLLEGIVKIAQEGYEEWQINSTPSFVINETEVVRGNMNYDSFLEVLNIYAT